MRTLQTDVDGATRQLTPMLPLMRRLAGLGQEPAKRLKHLAPLRAEVSAVVVGGLNYGRDIAPPPGTPVSMQCFDRVSRLIELLQRVNVLVDRSDRRSRRECQGLIRELNRLSERYKWSPAYKVSTRAVTLSWRFTDPQSWEDTAVWWIRRLVEDNLLHRLRRCSQCGSWFYAATEHQRFCDEKCRKKNASESPIFKEKRRRYMRENYRPLLKKLGVTALKMARRR